MNSNIKIYNQIVGFIILLGFAAARSLAQVNTLQKEREFADSAGSIPWISIGLVAIVAIVGGIILWRRMRKPSVDDSFGFENRIRSSSSAADYDDVNVDAEKELEWFRKAKKSTAKVEVRTGMERRSGKRRLAESSGAVNESEGMQLDSKQFQDRMRKLQYAQLPINSFIQLADARPFDPLPLSADPGLLSAIEQANEEYEDDETVRELAVKILAAFRSRNSVESLSQIAIYDLSANVRSKAVQTLTEFDHESVFEPLLLACADPTREVRAAAARGLFRLSFDRAEAWKRIIATGDEYRMKHSVRAAVESGIVQKSFDRLIHEDMRIAYEAFTLVGLLIKSGETESIFEAISEHKDERVRFALLHVLKVVKDEQALVKLEELMREGTLSEELTRRIIETVKGTEPVAA